MSINLPPPGDALYLVCKGGPANVHRVVITFVEPGLMLGQSLES